MKRESDILVFDPNFWKMKSCGESKVMTLDGKGCIDRDECLTNPCLNGGLCINREPFYLCDCPDGYFGENCEFLQQGQIVRLSMGALAAILVCLLIILSEWGRLLGLVFLFLVRPIYRFYKSGNRCHINGKVSCVSTSVAQLDEPS